MASTQSRLNLPILLIPLYTPHQISRLSGRSRYRALINHDTRQHLLYDILHNVQIVECIRRLFENRKDDDADERCGRG